MTNNVQVWKADLYDNKHSYVSQLGQDLKYLLNPVSGERILDLGCGTGDLAFEFSQTGASVIGIDLSSEMIGLARKKYPDIHFVVGNGEGFQFDEPFDAIFSNAALHWMTNAEQVIQSVCNGLKSGGRFVAEFGGRGNVETIIRAISDVLREDYGKDASPLNPWFFPSIAEYSTLLEQQGFRVTFAAHFDRPTRMEDGEDGCNHWLDAYADSFFVNMLEDERKIAFDKIADKARAELFKNDAWYMDYKRIRIMATKP